MKTLATRHLCSYLAPHLRDRDGKVFPKYHFILALGLGAILVTPTLVHAQTRTFPPFPTERVAPKVQTGLDGEARAVADRAWSLFERAWATGEWQPFFDMTTDDFQFYFPQGEFAGLHEGADGKTRLVAWGEYHRRQGNRIRSVLLRATYGGNTAIYETTAESIPPGFYRNYEAIIFEVRGDRISALREYWNVLEPGRDTSGN